MLDHRVDAVHCIFLSEKGYPLVLLFQRALAVFHVTFSVAFKRRKNEKNLRGVSHIIQRIVYYPMDDLLSCLLEQSFVVPSLRVAERCALTIHGSYVTLTRDCTQIEFFKKDSIDHGSL